MSIYTPKRKTANGTEEVQFPISAINGLEEALSNASSSASAQVTDLSGSIWKLNSKVNVQEMYYQIDFVSNGETFDQLIGSFATTGLLTTHMQYSMTGSTATTVYTQFKANGSWNDYNYRIIEISGGRDATNAALIDWLYANGQLLHFDISNLATVNKVKSIYTWLQGASELGTDDGIYWQSKFTFNDKEALEGNDIASGDIYQRIPLIAGDNIEFEILDSSQTVKINATGGGGDSGASNGFEMPQIRFVNAIYFDETKVVNGAKPMKLTVEIVGGGALQVGDKLQICAKRTYGYKDAMQNSYRKQKLRKQQEYTITEEDLGKRFLVITTGSNPNPWLFKNDRNNSFYKQQIDTVSPFYLRIKRATAYSSGGVESNAIFSNVVTVWKTYNNLSKEVNIK